MRGLITDIHRTSTVDGPGIRTTVFTKGCPLRCLWCHNPETQQSKIEAGYGTWVSVDQVVDECLKDTAYYDESGGGVTISGGEPAAQYHFSFEILHRLKVSGVHTALDTSGFATQSVFAESLEVADLYLFDYKATDPALHRSLVGESPTRILENLDFLMESGAEVILRCPLVPGINDQESHLLAISEMESRYPDLRAIQLLPWHRMGTGKYGKLGRVPDPRLPRESAPVDIIEIYRQFFLRRDNHKVTVLA